MKLTVFAVALILTVSCQDNSQPSAGQDDAGVVQDATAELPSQDEGQSSDPNPGSDAGHASGDDDNDFDDPTGNDDAPPPVDPSGPPILELIGLEVTDSAVRFKIFLVGCGGKADYEVLSRETYPLQLELTHKSGNVCQIISYKPEWISFSFEELGMSPGTSFEVSNPRARFQVPDEPFILPAAE